MSQAEVIWALAWLGEATAAEVDELLGQDRGRSSSDLLSLWRNELLMRRKRGSDTPGKDPYEYCLRRPEALNSEE